MKFRTPDYLINVKSPIEGELALRAHFQSRVIVGVDEVGRGPLAGPVVACAAVLKNPVETKGLNDSKKLSRKKREEMFESVKENCLCYAIASASAREIDEMNILSADFLAMRRALSALGFRGLAQTPSELPIQIKGVLPVDSEIVIAVDGNLKITGVPFENQVAVIKGDGCVASISAASILAKVTRDRYMEALAVKYPGYAFEVNAGYGTKAHLDGLRELGPTPEHRRSFHPKSLQTELL
ncbi:MAG: ribonuclease HII [Fibrobacteraceae bacterium]|nr:ribonuclease HII [Fibrobacteraceae bacterium]